MERRESFVFYESFYDAIDSLPEEQQAVAYKAIIEYGLHGKEPEPGNMGYTLWLAFRKQIDKNQKRYENSLKGGRKKSKSETKDKPKDNQTETEQEPNENQNETKKEEVEVTEKQNIPYQEIVDLYNSVCVSLPKVRGVSDSRRNAIRSRYKTYGMDGIKKVFESAEESDFLSGRNGKWSSCNFDWLMKQANFLKVLEGTYQNKGGVNNGTIGLRYTENEINQIFAADII